MRENKRMQTILTILLYLFAITFFIGCNNNQTILNSRLTADTIDYSYTWINKSYLSKLRILKSHAKLWDKYEISCIGLAPSEQEMMILVKKFRVSYGYKQKIVNNELLLYPDEPDQTDTVKVIWLEKGKSFLINKDTLVKTTITDPNSILQSLLYLGTYKFNNKTVTFQSDGTINNFDYDFLIPENADHNIDGNDIVELKNFNERKMFATEFINDTLKIFDFICERFDTLGINCVKGKKGQLKYSLVKE